MKCLPKVTRLAGGADWHLPQGLEQDSWNLVLNLYNNLKYIYLWICFFNVIKDCKDSIFLRLKYN